MPNDELPREKLGGENAGLVESAENMKPSPLFPPSLVIATEERLPHSHRTTTTIEFGQFYFVAGKTINFAATESRCPEEHDLAFGG
jgi:hypothetical protein